MIHYHGTPITPRLELLKMAGRHFCVSFAHPSDADTCMSIGQSVMWDNGAFSLFTRGRVVDWDSYYDWVDSRLGHPHWAVVPDVIGGEEADNFLLAKTWPHRRELAAPVWHLHESLGQLGRLIDLGFGKLCFGSSGDYWEVGSARWEHRVDQAFNWLDRSGPLPWVHMLRGLDLGGRRWPFASADSTNVARNFKCQGRDPESMARRIDARQCPIHWQQRYEQEALL